MLTVVKVGGGLVREAGPGALRALCARIAEEGARHPLLVVPGGAAFAGNVLFGLDDVLLRVRQCELELLDLDS